MPEWLTPPDWMVWTTPTAVVFAGIAALLCALAVWARLSPPVARVGFLRISTDRGDRVYIGLISAALFLVLWIAFTDLSMWLALALAALLAGVIGRWG
jgi:predicted small integral membrane protein